MSKKKIIYVMDPHCGWCYGNSDKIMELHEKFGNQLAFDLLVGGMWLGDSAPRGGKALSDFIQAHSPQMERTTGAYVDESFYKLTADENYVFSSLEPAAAIVLVKKIAFDHTFLFAKEVQKAIFKEGKRLDDIATYRPIVAKLQIPLSEFEEQWMNSENIKATQEEFKIAQQLANGFPTMLFQNNDEIGLLTSGYINEEAMKQLSAFFENEVIN